MSGTPPVVHYCVSCRHPAHGGRVCGAATFFTRTCLCGAHIRAETDPPMLTEQGRRALRDDCICPPLDPDPDCPYHGNRTVFVPDFDERKAYREHDEGWYPDDRD